jgi:TRAP-type C4-dicarboxylate transport system permease small subunit
MKNIADWLELWCFRFSGAMLSLICLIIGWQVFARKVLNDSPSWSEPLALLLLLFTVMLASAAGCRTQLHIGLYWFRQQFPQRFRFKVSILEYLVIGALGVVMCWYGYAMLVKTFIYQLPGLPVSMGMQYLPLVLGGGLIAFFNVERLINLFSANEEVNACR